MEGLKTSQITEEGLPLVIEPSDSNLTFGMFLKLIKDNQKSIKDKILTHGGVLFRNFPVESAQEFEEVIKTLDLGGFIDYIGGDSPRNKITEHVYTSTEAPPSIKIPLHNELSFVKNHPKHIYFFCEIPPQVNGETIIADARKIYRSVEPEVRDRFISHGLKYVSCYYDKSALMDFINSLQPSHKSWHQVFESESKDDVEEKCRANEFGFQWNKNDWLQISQKRPAVMEHAETKENIWFNQVHLYDFNPRLLGLWRYVAAKIFYMPKHMRLHEVFFSDGTSIPKDDIYHVLDVLDANTIYFPWKKGDLLVLDNVLSMHGRAPFKGKRRVLTAMTG